jgi:TolA-binding protein
MCQIWQSWIGSRHRPRRPLVAGLALAVWAFLAGQSAAQSFRHAGTEFNAVRSVAVPAEKGYSTIVVEFLHHGELHADGANVLVSARNNERVPVRVLQVGPGDSCRLAFQTVKGQSEYEVFYGGDPPREDSPPWTCRDGLLLETRQFQRCDFWSLDSVRSAFKAAAPLGADFVDGVFHGCNPFSLKREPFLSRYIGYLNLDKAGTYGFVTSSQDCSFLLIDGKPAASAPGYHGPARHARPGTVHDVALSAGQHKFEYYHAAAGPSAMMAVDWAIGPSDGKSRRPTTLPADVFRGRLIGRVPAGRLSLRTAKTVPDFTMKIIGDVPLPDNDVPLLGVSFRNNSPKALTMQGAKLQWQFGDGQTSTLADPAHVYLRPGLYPVTLAVRRGGKTLDITNRIYVDRPLQPSGGKLHTLDECLKVIDTYDPKTLDALSVRQMVLAFEAKAAAVGDRSGSASEDWLAKAVAAGRAAFDDDSAAKGDQDLLKLAKLVGPMARLRLGDSESAFQIWRGAARRIVAPGMKAESEVAAADLAVNDLLKAAVAKLLLEAAAKRLGRGQAGPIAAMFHRISGDYAAATGDGSAARKEYVEADRLTTSPQSFAAKTARLGAHARSVEQFIKEKQFARAAEELDAWQRQFPAEKIDGYLTLLQARYWSGRGKHAQAIAQAEQLQAVNPDSPYMDQLLFLAAESEMRLGRKDRALATLQSLVKDYPGSPLAPLAKKNIGLVEGREERK